YDARASAWRTAWNRASTSKGFVRKSTAPAFMARTAIGMSPWPVMKMTGRGRPRAASASWRSKPLCSGIRTSSTRQLGPSGAMLGALALPDRFHGIEHEIQDDLLQLYGVAGHERQVGVELEPDRHVANDRVAAHELRHALDQRIEVERHRLGLALAQEISQAFDDVAGPPGVLDDIAHDRAQLVSIQGRDVEKLLGGLGVGQDSGQGLVQLVGQRCGQLADRRPPREVREVPATALGVDLRALALRHVGVRNDGSALMMVQGHDGHREP